MNGASCSGGLPPLQRFVELVSLSLLQDGMKRSHRSLELDPLNRSSSSRPVRGPTEHHGQVRLKSGALVEREQRKRAHSRSQKVHDTSSGFLRRARLRKEVTRQSYSSAWKTFLEFCVEHRRLPGTNSRFVSVHQIDQCLEAFAESQFLDGASKYVFTFALQNANIEYPCWPTSSRMNYPLSKSAKKGWSNLEPGASRGPCPYEVCMIAEDLVTHRVLTMLRQ